MYLELKQLQKLIELDMLFLLLYCLSFFVSTLSMQFNCSTNDTCDYIDCLNSETCIVNCNGTGSCSDSIINCGFSDNCNILCNYGGSCDDIVINGTNANYLNLTFYTRGNVYLGGNDWDTSQNYPCALNGSIICPIKGKKRCEILCDDSGGNNACDNLGIYAKEGS